MILTRSRNHCFSLFQFPFFARDVKNSTAPQNQIDLIRFGMGMDALILARFQTVKIAEVFRRFKQRQFLHLLVRKADKFFKVPNFHSRVAVLYYE